MASKTAPSQPKHDVAESQRGPRHVSSARLIPACAREAGSPKTQRASLPRLHIRCDSSAQAEKQQQGRGKEGQRSPQECHRHVCYRILSAESHDCARMRPLHAAAREFSTSENWLNCTAATLPCEIMATAKRCDGAVNGLTQRDGPAGTKRSGCVLFLRRERLRWVTGGVVVELTLRGSLRCLLC